MPVSWTAAMDQRLLLVVLAAAKIDTGAVARKWHELFGDSGSDRPTPRAITERLAKLRKTLGISGAKTSSPAKQASFPSTPPSAGLSNSKSSPVTKGKTSSNAASGASPKKRQRRDMSDEDDTEPEPLVEIKEEESFHQDSIGSALERLASETRVRTSHARQAKTNRKPLLEIGLDDDATDHHDTASMYTDPLTPASSPPEQEILQLDEQRATVTPRPTIADGETPESIDDEIVVSPARWRPIKV